MRWVIGILVSAVLAGCGGGTGVVGGGSPQIAPGTYRGAEDWKTGIIAGVRIPIVAVALAGNHFAYSDLGAPGGLPYNGAAMLPLDVDATGHFSAAVAQGNFGALGFIPAGVFSGRNLPNASPQLSGAITMSTGDATWTLTRQAGQGNPFEGLYAGNFSAPESGPVNLLVGSDGVAILLRGPALRWAETAVGAADPSTGSLSFGYLDAGTALDGTIAGGTASGNYTFTGVGSGTWTAAKQ